MINKIGRAILEAKPTEEIAYDVLGYVRNLFACKRVSVVLFDYESNEAFVLAVDTDSDTKIDKGSRFSLDDFHVKELNAGEIVSVHNIHDLEIKTAVDSAFLSESIVSYLRIPLFYNALLIGSLNFGHEDYNVFNNENLKIVQQIAAPLAIAIQNARFVNKIILRENDLKRMSERLISSQEEERKKISLELHDELGQALTAINMNLSIIEKTLSDECNNPTARNALNETIDYVNTMADQLRDLSHELRPPMLDVLGLIPALKSHINGINKRTGIHIEMTFENVARRFLPDAEITLFRIVQESLHNVIKHSKSHDVSVIFKQLPEKLQIQIEDDGIGISKSKIAKSDGVEPGMGIIGMEERVSNLGGTLTITSGHSRGTLVILEIPLHSLFAAS